MVWSIQNAKIGGAEKSQQEKEWQIGDLTPFKVYPVGGGHMERVRVAEHESSIQLHSTM